MSPRRANNPPLTLGFFGSGTTSIKGALALIEDLIAANGGKARFIVPVTEEHWTEGIEAVVDLASDKGYALEVVTDDTTAKFRPVKGHVSRAAKQHKSARPGTKIVNLVADAGGKVIVFWDDENDEIYDVIEAAAEVNVDALDVCAGLEKIELSPEEEEQPAEQPAEAVPDDEDELPEESVEEEEDQTEEEDDQIAAEGDDLAAMTDEEIEVLADELRINPEDFDSWDDVRDAIRSARTDDAGEADQAVTMTTDTPTAQDIEDWDFDKLKAFAQENEIDVPPRTRTSGYRAAVKGWLAQQGDEEEAYEPPEDEPLEQESEAEQAGFDKLVEMIERLATELDECFVGLHKALDDLGKRMEDRPAQKASRGPSGASGATKTAAKSTGPQTKAEEVMAPVLKWADGDSVSKPTAAKILELWEQRPKGRPTERERRLYALARSVIPEEKRRPGRPRKTG